MCVLNFENFRFWHISDDFVAIVTYDYRHRVDEGIMRHVSIISCRYL